VEQVSATASRSSIRRHEQAYATDRRQIVNGKTIAGKISECRYAVRYTANGRRAGRQHAMTLLIAG
jgi:hypothetical protein